MDDFVGFIIALCGFLFCAVMFTGCVICFVGMLGIIGPCMVPLGIIIAIAVLIIMAFIQCK